MGCPLLITSKSLTAVIMTVGEGSKKRIHMTCTVNKKGRELGYSGYLARKDARTLMKKARAKNWLILKIDKLGDLHVKAMRANFQHFTTVKNAMNSVKAA